MSDYPMLISNKLHSFRNFMNAKLEKFCQSCLNFQFEFVNNHIFGVEIWFAIRIVIRG